MKTLIRLTVSLAVLAATSAHATVRYVDANSAHATPPYTDWATAAKVIQVAVDAAAPGDEIVVTNGTYATGGRAVGTNLLVNRVAVDKPLTLRSVNGPQFTVIQGYQMPGTTNGDGAIRCVYLTNGASLSGFTLTNGATRSVGNYQHDSTGGGARCESWGVMTNCVLSGNSAEYGGGGAYGGILNNCTLTGNSVTDNPAYGYGYGGGVADSTLNNCVLSGNSAYGGGGAYGGILNNCVLTGNLARNNGGGASGGTLDNCTLSGNSARIGGGASWGTLNKCVLTGNSADNFGGGVYGGTLNNCTLTGNSADNFGGGASGAMMGGGTLNNCIVYFNTARTGANYYTDEGFSIEMNSCCTTPLPAGGTGNITLDPQLASATHLSVTSPCRGAGSAAYATGLDIDGEAWATPPSIGCDEFHAGTVTGPLSVGIVAAFTNVAAGFPLELTALIDGRTIASGWEFGDGRVASNQPYVTHAWAAPGDYAVILRAYNESHAEGVSATVTVHVAAQPVHYVAVDAAHPLPPYTSWATAARNIQDAVDAASTPGALVLVTNGIYTAGGRAVGTNLLVNRVAVDKPLTLRSVNGPQLTVVQGYQVPGTTNGDSAIRCVYLADGASLSGFTLTNGATRNDGEWEREQSGGGAWCERTAVVFNCVLSGNSANAGGGAYGGTLNNCTLTGNRASFGGGVYGATLDNCVLSGNSASDGGGASGGTLNNCTISANSAASNGGGVYGGGLYNCTLNNCTLTGNAAGFNGGGACRGTLQNCALTDNSAASNGGGAYGGTLNNCTLTGNAAGVNGGGAYGGALNRGVLGYTLNNCIVYFNRAPNGANYGENTFTYSCTTPLPPGPGNIDADPQLASSTHLSPLSPCIGAGSPAYATGVDIDGEAWASPPSIGCDEYHAGAVTGPLSVSLVAAFTNVAAGFPVDLTALIDGRTTARVWDFGDGLVASNQPYATHAWTAPGNYAVILRAYNESHAEGVSATVTIHVMAQPVHYVATNSAHPLPPYTSWATAARNIQDAVDVASTAGALVLVTNRIYTAGGHAVGTNGVINRVAVDKPLKVRSVNGPPFTVIHGGRLTGEEIRCVYLASGASLSGFTLTHGTTRSDGDYQRERSGGGVWSESFGVVTNCVLIANSTAFNGGGAHGGTLDNCVLSDNSAEHGGGAGAATLNNCTLTGNSAEYGGGVAGSTLNNCVLSGNSAASEGGGAYYGTLNNCIAYFNMAPGEPNCANSTLNYCCTTPLPQPWQGGSGNITDAPLFVDYAGGNLRLQSNSPCINAGNNAYVPGTTDLDGLPRIVSGTVDIGAYEFQGPGSMISYAWLQHYGLPTDGSADTADLDGDRLDNWREWRCLTDPADALSGLRLLSPESNHGTNVTVTWQSVEGVSYFLERSTNLSATPPFTPLATSLPGQPGTTTFTDTNAVGVGPFFYRVGVGF